MKRAISLILIVGLVCVPCAFCLAADEAGTGITVNQTHASYAQWSNQSPMHMGSLSGTDSLHPISLAIPSATIGTISSATAPSIVIDVSDPLIGVKDTVVYVGFYEAYGVFHGSNSMSTYFVWSDDIPGYTMRAAASTSYGPVSPQDLTVTAPSNFSPTVKRTQAGSSSGATFSTSAVSVVGTYTPVVRVPQSVGSAYMDPYWKVATSSYKVIKVTIGSDNANYSNVRIELDTDDVSKVKGSGSSGNYLLSGVFVPLCYVVDATGYNQSMLDKLDEIIQALADLNQNVTDSTADIITILNDNFADILASIGTSTGNRDTILFYLSTLVTNLGRIIQGLEHYGGNNPSSSYSAIQYIEYYLRNVLTNTDTIAAYIADISNTLDQISNTIQSANDQLDAIDGTAEDVHDQEDAIFNDATQAIENQIIDGFAFDADFGLGAARAGLDWTALWNAIGPWNQVIMFSMMMTYAFTILRFRKVPRDHQSPSNDKKDG